jgi:hypothetical protein
VIPTARQFGLLDHHLQHLPHVHPNLLRRVIALQQCEDITQNRFVGEQTLDPLRHETGRGEQAVTLVGIESKGVGKLVDRFASWRTIATLKSAHVAVIKLRGFCEPAL